VTRNVLNFKSLLFITDVFSYNFGLESACWSSVFRFPTFRPLSAGMYSEQIKV